METKRMVSPGAELMMGQKFKMLDLGSLELVDYLGCDNTVVAAARHRYDKGLDQEDTIGNEKLINFLLREYHTSPFEQPSMVFEVKAPILVFREWHRHRIGRLNEMSARYAQLLREFYVPDMSRVQKQSKANKQGSGETFDSFFASEWCDGVRRVCNQAFDLYEASIEAGVAKELARVVLPVNTYSKMVFQLDLNNWMKFLKLRMSPRAQYEIRVYANQIAEIMKAAYPVVHAAFEEYILYAQSFSRSEMATLIKMLEGPSDALDSDDPDQRKIYKKLELV